jgi:hypothetical protein
VIVNRSNTGGAANWDVGVLEQERVTNLALGSYRAKHVVDQDIAFGAVVAVTMPEDEMLLLREFRILPGQVGPVSVTVRVDPADGPLHVQWLANDFTTGDIFDDYDLSTITDDAGLARLDFAVDAAGYNCLVIYRDPEAAPAAAVIGTPRVANPASVPIRPAAQAIDLTVEVRTTPPDFVPYAAAGWYAPLVPRPAPDGSPSGVPYPDSLIGDTATTFFNVSVQNNSPTASAEGMVSRVSVDGVDSWSRAWAAFPAGSHQMANLDTARTVRGGRHSLALRVDAVDAFEEWNEDNDVFGEQWVWTPATLPTGVGVTRQAPPVPVGGWAELTTDGPLHYNCDGIRTPVFSPSGSNGYWGGVATMPGPGSDVDIRLHEKATNVKDGFGPYLKSSNGGSADYLTEIVSSVFRGGSTTGGDSVQITVGPVTLGPNRVLDLHEFYLEPGSYHFVLESAAGSVDWGLALHDAGVVHHAKSSVYTSVVGPAIAWLGGAGIGEDFFVALEEPGYYCAGVWKARNVDLSQTGVYFLHVTQTLPVDVAPDPVPRRITWLWPPQPNPFISKTVARFEIPDGRDVLVQVFDVRGARVRTLSRGPRRAGEHWLTWDGRNDAGRPLPCGVYQIRLIAGKYQKVQKVVRLR